MRPPRPEISSASRDRVDELRRLASAIETSPVVRLDPDRIVLVHDDLRARMCARLLHRNIEQLHAAADHLRDVAWIIERER